MDLWNTIIVNPFINTLLFIYNIVGHNFGLAIILFTFLIRLLTHPLMMKQIKSSTAMQELQKNPRWLEAQEKYKGDKEKLAQEQMAIYKELGINPFASCLPTLIQFPIIFGLYQAIIYAMANTPIDILNLIRHIYPGVINTAALIPLNKAFLWMDLSQPERLVIPGLGFGIPILTVLVVLTTYIQGKLITPASTPGSKDQSAMMGNMMSLYMPFFMGYLAYTLAAGLALYFVASNLVSILQYGLLGKLNWSAVFPFLGKQEPQAKPKQLPKKKK